MSVRRQCAGLACAVSGAVLLGLLAGCESAPRVDPVQVKLGELDQRLATVERVVNNQSLVQLSQRVDALEAQLREQHGHGEELQNGAEALRKQQRDLYADLDRRIRALESEASHAPTAAAPPAGSAAVSAAIAPAAGAAGVAHAPGCAPAAGDAADHAAYTCGLEALNNGDSASAIARLRQFLTDYPQSPLADHAQYWLGEAYYIAHQYEAAAAAFRAVGEHYASSRKAPDALLKLGFAQYELKHLTEARATLEAVRRKYPGTDAAHLAEERLARMPPDAP